MKIKRILVVTIMVSLLFIIFLVYYLYTAREQDIFVSNVLKKYMYSAETLSFKQLPIATVDDLDTGAHYLAPDLTNPRLTQKVFKHNLALLVTRSAQSYKIIIINAWLTSPDFTQGTAIVVAKYRNKFGQFRQIDLRESFSVPHYKIKN
ncbi:hypothetical protein C7445_1362 [Alicyclobacillus sacchari]|uniref:Uncharacterized protein n=1 Tax=Alicyclobacillus sacchari TaxID=392010 RepID=A0A4R8L892_9BACL|nr:hypothetical protein [Alicyclobacillus sacchari]TDY38259.1 hypothetical protein C7445_1362 [Alicyclobacillus sacchari]GMA59446.1 hypothetical protein GCM10025858_39500 [Alicyclobacillus sacchari]GMA59537.1 hypothetical protein GCM10025858_40410 [Alicyclobacillus sacchari]